MEHKAADTKRNLILLVPGFHEKPQRNQSLESLVSHFSASLGCTKTSSITGAGYAGKQLSAGPTNTQYLFFELYWQDLASQLTDEKIFTQMVRGVSLLIGWAWRALTRPKKYLVWGLYLTLGVLAMAFWVYGISAIGLNSLGNVQGVDKTLVEESKRVATWMLAQPVWAYASLLFGILSINVGAFADITDLITRYFTECIESNGLTLREQYAQMICQSVSSIVAQGPFEQVTIVGHSFGCAIIVDAIASPHNDWLPPCKLVTLGGFMEFLTWQYPSFSQRIQRSLVEQKITKWLDFYAADDWFTSNTPLPTTERKYEGILTNNEASIPDRLTLRSHGYYFKNQTVLEALM